MTTQAALNEPKQDKSGFIRFETEPHIIRSSKRFGVATLNVRTVFSPLRRAETGGGPRGINGGVGPANDGSNRVSIYAQVKDLQVALDRAEHLGGKTILPRTEVPGGLTRNCPESSREIMTAPAEVAFSIRKKYVVS
jgi:predicted enzyme related to lactoylglutathione lyase